MSGPPLACHPKQATEGPNWGLQSNWGPILVLNSLGFLDTQGHEYNWGPIQELLSRLYKPYALSKASSERVSTRVECTPDTHLGIMRVASLPS